MYVYINICIYYTMYSCIYTNILHKYIYEYIVDIALTATFQFPMESAQPGEPLNDGSKLETRWLLIRKANFLRGPRYI